MLVVQVSKKRKSVTVPWLSARFEQQNKTFYVFYKAGIAALIAIFQYECASE